MLRTNTCGELTSRNLGKTITLAGWVHSVRVHGKLVFLDLRDRYGMTQCVSQKDLDFFKHLKKESVVQIIGKVQKRQSGQENKEMITGEIEIVIKEINVLSEALPTPFKVEDEVIATEDTRMKYRYLDLRRKPTQDLIILRHKAAKAIRDYLDKEGFLEIETPMLAKSTPEGARDYLVPSRVHPHSFYALPQSPQLYKQLLMIAGFDKYFQIVRCFRDEDLRADRQPEFTQLDIEMSFIEEEDLYKLMDEMIKHTFKVCLNKTVKTPIKQMDYHEAMDTYGSDRPDLRFKMELIDLSKDVKGCGFKVLENGGNVKAIVAKNASDLISKKFFKRLEERVKKNGGKGLVEIRFDGKEFTGGVVQFLKKPFVKTLIKKLAVKKGDVVFMVADQNWAIACECLGIVRTILGDKLITDKKGFEFLWVVKFPLMLYSEEEKRWVSSHHPFTAPLDEEIKLMDKDLGKVRSKSYDLVLNGTELGGGSIRISNSKIQEKVFEKLGISKDEANEKFGFFTEALQYGTPPHGGIAFGLDRVIALMAGTNSIRDVIAFPKNKYAQSLMVSSPSKVAKKQLDELSIQLKKQSK